MVETCLAKDPEERFQTAHDVKLQLRWISQGGSRVSPAPVVRHKVSKQSWMIATALLAISTLALGVAYLKPRPAPPAPPVTRFAFSLPAGKILGVTNYPALASRRTEDWSPSWQRVRACASFTCARCNGSKPLLWQGRREPAVPSSLPTDNGSDTLLKANSRRSRCMEVPL